VTKNKAAFAAAALCCLCNFEWLQQAIPEYCQQRLLLLARILSLAAIYIKDIARLLL